MKERAHTPHIPQPDETIPRHGKPGVPLPAAGVSLSPQAVHSVVLISIITSSCTLPSSSAPLGCVLHAVAGVMATTLTDLVLVLVRVRWPWELLVGDAVDGVRVKGDAAKPVHVQLGPGRVLA